jgi:hypothetical protein
LILQIQIGWFCSIWSPKTEIIDKTVNSFQLNLKKNKKKFCTDRTVSAQPAQMPPAARRPAPHRAVDNICRPRCSQQCPFPLFFLLFFSLTDGVRSSEHLQAPA